MSVNDWSGIVVGIATIILLWQQNRIFQRQNEIFAAQAGTTMPDESLRRARFRRYWPMLGIALLALLTWSAVGYDIYDRHHPRFGYDANNAWDDSKPLVRVYNSHFRNETVYVDGKNFIDPVFDGVTLIYNGTGPFSMENAQWILHDKQLTSGIGTRNKVVAAAFLLHCALAQASGCRMGCVNEGPNAPQILDMPPLPK